LENKKSFPFFIEKQKETKIIMKYFSGLLRTQELFNLNSKEKDNEK
jgi:hypothetical protein